MRDAILKGDKRGFGEAAAAAERFRADEEQNPPSPRSDRFDSTNAHQEKVTSRHDEQEKGPSSPHFDRQNEPSSPNDSDRFDRHRRNR